MQCNLSTLNTVTVAPKILTSSKLSHLINVLIYLAFYGHKSQNVLLN